METKEYFYDYNFLDDFISSLNYKQRNEKELKGVWNKIYCFLFKRFYNAKNTAIDYCNKIVYIQFDYRPTIEDKRIFSANSRIIELHYPDLKTLFLSIFRRNRLA